MTEKLAPGTRVDDRYVILRRLGAGGFGEVWLAKDDGSLSQPVALKVLHPRVLEIGEVVRDRFEQEAAILARLDHPSIVRPLAFSMTESRAYLAMEYVDGVPLARVLKQCAHRDEHLDAAEAERVFDELCSAVQYIHEQGVVHRDLKPSNVMFVRRGGRAFVKLLDLGVARILTPNDRDATTLGRVVGSLHYASPEQVRGERADARSDVFGLGTILFELVTACRAFIVDEAGLPARAYKPPLRLPTNALPRVTGRILGGPRPKPSDAREGIPLALDEVVARALAIDPAERFASAAQLADAARPLLRELGASRGTTIYAVMSQIVDVKTDPSAEDPDPTPLLPTPTFDATATAPVDEAGMASVIREEAPPHSRWILGAGMLAVVAGVAFAVVRPSEEQGEARRTRQARVVPRASAAGGSPGGPAIAERNATNARSVEDVGSGSGRDGAGGASPASAENDGSGSGRQDASPTRGARSGSGGGARSGTGGGARSESAGARSGSGAARSESGAARAGSGAARRGSGAARRGSGGARGESAGARSGTGGAARPGARGGGARGRSSSGGGADSPAAAKERVVDPPTPPPPRFPTVRRALAAARANPSDLARVAALGDALRRAAAGLPDGPGRARLLRRIEANEMSADVDGLGQCVRTLEAIE